MCAGGHRGHKRPPDPLGLVLQVVMSYLRPGLGANSGPLKSSKLLNVSHLSSFLVLFSSLLYERDNRSLCEQLSSIKLSVSIKDVAYSSRAY